MLTPHYAENYHVMAGIIDEEPLVEMTLEDIVQPGGKEAWNPLTNKLDFVTRILKVRECKVDLQIFAQKLYKTYLGTISASKGTSTPYELPFEAFIMDFIAQKAQNNIYLKALWKGIYDANGSTPASTMDGFRTLIKAAQIAGDIPSTNIVATGTISNSNAVDKFELVANNIPDEYAHSELMVYVSPTLARYYNEDYRTSYGTLNYNKEFNKHYMDGFPNATIVSEPAMAGLDLVLITPKENMCIGMDLEGNLDNIEIEKNHRALDIMMDFKIAPQFAIAELMWMNDSSVYS
jgi:hypothetical protein